MMKNVASTSKVTKAKNKFTFSWDDLILAIFFWRILVYFRVL